MLLHRLNVKKKTSAIAERGFAAGAPPRCELGAGLFEPDIKLLGQDISNKRFGLASQDHDAQRSHLAAAINGDGSSALLDSAITMRRTFPSLPR